MKDAAEWTAEKPTVPGWYWHWSPETRTVACEVVSSRAYGLTLIFPIGWWGTHDWISLADPSGELPHGSKWYGPLEPPPVPSAEGGPT